MRTAFGKRIYNRLLLSGIGFGITLRLFFGCSGKHDDITPAASVGGTSISAEELIARYGLHEDQFGYDLVSETAILKEAAKKWALEEILIQEARKRKLDQDSLFKARIENLQREILINLLYETSTASIEVDLMEIREVYDDHRGEYIVISDQIEMVYILAPTRTLGDQVRRMFLAGSNLDDILMIDSSLSGEETGWVDERDLDPKISNIAFSLVPGGISYPIKFDPPGYIVMKCQQRRQAGTMLPLEEVKDKIRDRLLLEKKFEAEKALRDSLWACYNPNIIIGSEK